MAACLQARTLEGCVFQTHVVDGLLVMHKAIARITIESVLQATGRWFDDHRFDPSLPVLWDCRDQFIEVSLADLATIHDHLAGYRSRRRHRERDSRSAVLVSNMTSAAALSMLEDNHHLMPDIRIFNDPGEAHTWLGVSPADLDATGASGQTPCARA